MLSKRVREGIGWAAVLASIALIGAVDLLTGPRVSLSLFYAIPIALGAWYLGPRAALFTSAAAGLGLYLSLIHI